MRLIDADYMKMLVDIHGTNKYGMLDENIRVFIDQQPTVNSAPHWIPVTERLPEYGEKVLVTFRNKNIGRRTIGVSSCYVQKEGFFSDTPFDYAPIAWMPLPMPWEGGAEDA